MQDGKILFQISDGAPILDLDVAIRENQKQNKTVSAYSFAICENAELRL